MKIFHLTTTYPPYHGGIGSVVSDLHRGLLASNIDSKVITIDYQHVRASSSSKSVVRVKPLMAVGNAAIIPPVVQCLKESDVIVLHYPCIGLVANAIMAKIFYKKKLVVIYYMDLIATDWYRKIIFKLYLIFSLPLLSIIADRWIFSSKSYWEQSIAYQYTINRKKNIAFLPYGARNELVDLAQQMEPTRARGGAARLLFVGGLDDAHYFKGLDNLITSLSMLPSAIRWQLEIVGRGGNEQHFAQRIKAFHLEDKISIFNNVDTHEKLSKKYHIRDIIILPSINRSEAFGLVLIEAGLFGCFVVASNLPGVSDVVKSLEGELVVANNTESLEETLRNVINNISSIRATRQRRARMSANHYSWTNLIPRYIDIFHNVYSK